MKTLALLALLQLCTDINTATRSELTAFAGVTEEIADRIIKGRPYKSASDAPKEILKNPICVVGQPVKEIIIVQGNETMRIQYQSNPLPQPEATGEKRIEKSAPPPPRPPRPVRQQMDPPSQKRNG